MAWSMISQHASKRMPSPPELSDYSISDVDYLKQVNHKLCQKRNIRTTLWKQVNLRQFHQLLLEKMRDDASDNLAVADETQQQFLEQQRDDTVARVAASSSSKVALQQQEDL